MADGELAVLGLAAHLGRGMQRVATDAVIGRMRSLPRTVNRLDAQTLSDIMGRRVSSVSVIGGDAGTSSRARLALTGDDIPASVFVKMPAETVATRLMGELGRLAQTEVLFYRELSSQLTGVPTAYGSAFDSLTGRLADCCEFPDTLHPLHKDRPSMIVELLAQLHATFWERLPPTGSGGPLGRVYSASDDHTSLLTGPLLNTSVRRLTTVRPGSATYSPSTAKPWRPEAAPSWIPTSSGCAIDRARCTRMSHR